MNIFDHKEIEVFYYKTTTGRNVIKIYHVDRVGMRLRCLYTGDENGKNTKRTLQDLNNSANCVVRVTGNNKP